MAFCYTKKLFLFITLNYVHGAVQKLKFERFGSTLQGIRCAIERSDITRFVKFDSATGKCVTLQEDWLIDKRVEKDTNYFIQTMSEPIFEPVRALRQHFLFFNMHQLALSRSSYVDSLLIFLL